MGFRIPILTYHKIAPVDSKSIYPGTYVPPRLFEKHIRYLVRKEFGTLRLDDLLSVNTQRKSIVLTFDDGFQDFSDNAFPILSKHKLHSTVFLVANHLGGTNEWDTNIGDTSAALMSAATVRHLQVAGVEFGSHTLSHAHLDRVTDEEQRIEVLESKVRLEKELGFNINTFCFPYGGYNDHTLTLVEEAGYKFAVSTEKGLNTPETDTRKLRRIAMRNDTSLPVFIYKLWRAYRLGK